MLEVLQYDSARPALQALRLNENPRSILRKKTEKKGRFFKKSGEKRQKIEKKNDKKFKKVKKKREKREKLKKKWQNDAKNRITLHTRFKNLLQC